ncbi:MAG TPA: class I SAM-dependent methyltransferase [Kofleriaceae bacterium]|jgi:SAM-dependent methyltransferase|nr:class I SAM-dependent methyltransferase [Kofleriaceae bacterium]
MAAAGTPRWGSQPVDLDEHSLPALKVNFLLDHTPDRGHLLEVGSGDGKILRTFARQRPDLVLHGCDVREWSERDPTIDFRRLTSNDLPYADRSLDAAMIADVLEHVDDPEHLVAELARVLRPGGRFVAFVPLEGEPRSAYSLYRWIFGADLYVRTKEHMHAFTFAQVEELLAPFFDIVHLEHAYHPLGQIMDATFFAATALPRLQEFWWRENRYYAPADEQTGRFAGALNRLLELGNAIAYRESRLFARWRLGAAGMLFEAHRKGA